MPRPVCDLMMTWWQLASGVLDCVGSFLACFHSEVDWIGHACAACYGVVIPCFLALLFAKQFVTMRQCKTFFAQSDDKEEVTLQLQVLSAAEPLKDRHVSAADGILSWNSWLSSVGGRRV